MLDFNAGKYAVFVWSAYGLSALVFLGLIVSSLMGARRWRREVERREAETRP
ncbi:MAG TPA: heme exporter protein CcmD [Caulobacteraceae bacterium]